MKKTIVLLLAAVLLAVLAGEESGARQKYPGTVTISYVDAPFNLQVMVMKERRMLEEAFSPLGIAIRWHTITTGAEQCQAMAAGSLDIAPVLNSTSVILANAAGNPVEIAATVSRPKGTFALMAAPGGPRNIRGFKGKTVAGPKGSVLHQMLVAALVKEGMRAEDVSFINMNLPEARNALIAKRVDGALQAGSLIIRSEEAGMRIVLTADGYLSPLLFTAVRPAFARQYPELLELYLKTQREAFAWIRANTAEAVALGSRIQQVSPEDGARLYEWSGMAEFMEEGDIEALRADMEFLFQQKMIERKLDPRRFIRGEGLIPRTSGAVIKVLNPRPIPFENNIPRCSTAGYVDSALGLCRVNV